MIAVITQCYLVISVLFVSVISQYIRHKLTDNSGHLDVTKPFIVKKQNYFTKSCIKCIKKLYKMYKNIQNIQKYITKRMRGLCTYTHTHKKNVNPEN